MGGEKLKILFVCTANQMRSKTAEVIYKDDERFTVKSAGVSDTADVPLNQELLNWADYIAVMETFHLEWIKHYDPKFYSQKHEKILCLDIPDIYNFMDFELAFQIQQKFETRYLEEIKPGWI
jgi:protein-tyrosine phosphatase